MTISILRRSRSLSAIALAMALPACTTAADLDGEDDLAASSADDSLLADDVKEAPAPKLWDQAQAIDNVLVRPYYRKTLTLTAIAGSHVIKTQDLQQLGTLPPDTVIIAQNGDSQQWTNDNCEGAASCVTIPGSLTSVTIAIFGRQPQAHGTTDLVIDGVVRENDVAFGGTLIPISWNPAGTDFAIHTVGKPNGTVDETIFHLDRDYRYKGSNTSSGILAHAKLIASPVQGDFILVASPATATNPGTGLTRVIFNSCLSETDDCTGSGTFNGDTDGDGLANYLEAQIGTSQTKKDTDGDGIVDYQEVIGVKLGGEEEDLPRYGADPRHADVFLEMDTSFWNGSNPPTNSNAPATEAIVTRLAEMFANLSNWSNPDGTTGIRIHVDGNAACSDPTLCGDWGGSNHYQHDCVTPSTATARANMAPLRQGVFHYTLRTCRGAQAPRGSAIIRIGPTNDEHNGEVWAHELGHNLGLHHWGNADVPVEGNINSTVVYPSTMNYAYQNGIGGDPDARFSRGLMQPIRPENQIESNYTPGVDKSYMATGPYYYGVTGNNVDFNGDGRIQGPVWFDPGPVGQRSGKWADVRDVRDIDNRVPTGGAGIAVLPTVSGGSTSRVYIAAPYSHGNGIYPDIRWTTDIATGDPAAFSAAVPSSPIPGGADPAGEVGAALVSFETGLAVFVTMPSLSGKLYYAHFRTWNHTWTGWTAMPGWTPSHRARQATVVNTPDRLYVLFRDMNAPENVPNVWMNTFEEGQWRGWNMLGVSSYLTPGLAVGPDGMLYLLHMTTVENSPTSVTLKMKLSVAAWEPSPAQLDFAPIDQLNWTGHGFGSEPLPDNVRPRINLLSVPYRRGGGAPFTDGSHHLAAYWASGEIGTDESQDNWILRRAYTPGYITASGHCFGATVTGNPCTASATVHTRFQKDIDRPYPAHSVAPASRWNVVSTAYTRATWDGDGDADNESAPAAIAYQPWSNGVYAGHWELRDTDDADIMRDYTCTSLWSLTGEQCKCDDSCSSLTSTGTSAKARIAVEPELVAEPELVPECQLHDHEAPTSAE
jgi:hypothetical protein